MSAFPSLPLFTDAFIADTGHLNATETGAYLMLLMVAWRTPECRLPDDDQRLARWARVDARSWARIKPKVMEFWTLTEGQWSQKRLLLERDKVRKFAEASRRNGTAGGRPKGLKNKRAENPAGSQEETQQKAPNPIPNPKGDSTCVESSAHARPIPEDWFPDTQGYQFAVEEGVLARDMQREVQRFRDSKNKTGLPIPDIPTEWRLWVSSPHAPHRRAQQPQPLNGHPHANGTYRDDRHALARAFDRIDEAIANGPGATGDSEFCLDDYRLPH